jgi:hypothetical protein
MHVPRACSLALQECGKHNRQSDEPSAPVTFNRIEQRIGIKPLKQYKRDTEPKLG